MAKFFQPFNAGQFDPAQMEFQSVPTGDYKVIAFESELKPVAGKAQSGYVLYKLRVIEGVRRRGPAASLEHLQ